MKKLFFIIMTSLVFASPALAQKETDQELQQLIDIVSTLRQADETTWENAKTSLNQFDNITVMDEIKSNNEYRPIGKNQFRLNTILNENLGYNKKMVRGEFLNGNSPYYNYSMTERGIKKDRTVSYEMSYREGKQTFIVMPFKKKVGMVEVKAFLNGHPVGESYTDNDGNIHLSINADVELSDKLRLDITNLSGDKLPVVIINHNTRK